jgi:hypothetical protein
MFPLVSSASYAFFVSLLWSCWHFREFDRNHHLLFSHFVAERSFSVRVYKKRFCYSAAFPSDLTSGLQKQSRLLFLMLRGGTDHMYRYEKSEPCAWGMMTRMKSLALKGA